MANPLNNSFETWTSPGNAGSTSGVCTNWTVYSVNGGTATREAIAQSGSYSVNCRGAGAGNPNQIGGLLSDAFALSNDYITFWKNDQNVAVTPIVKIFNSSDVELRSYTLHQNVGWNQYCIYVGDLKGINIKIRFQQSPTGGLGYYTLYDLVQCTDIPTGYALYNSSTSGELTPTEATASCHHSTDVPANAIDKNDTTRWHQNTSTPRANAWVKVDLGSTKKVASVIIRRNTDKTATFNVDVSIDNSNWTNIVTAQELVQHQEFYAINQNMRYIRVSNFGGTQTYGQIFEIRSYEYSSGYFNRDNYTYRKKLTVDSSLIDTTLLNFPTLVKLTESNFDFTKIQEDLDDIRFTSNDGETLLKYELDSKTTVRETHLLLHLDGTDGATTTTDASESAHVITMHGDAQLDTAQKKFGTASLLLDGTGDYIRAADSSDFAFGTGDFTIEMQIRPTQVTNQMVLIDTRNTNPANGIYFYIIGGKLNYYDYTTNHASTTTLSVNVWQHVCIVRHSGTLKFYVDGVEAGGSFSLSRDLTEQHFTLGVDYPVSSYYYSGWIDEVRVSKGIARYTSNFTPSTSEFTIPSTEVTEANFWVKIPSVSNSADTDIYIYYSNVSAINGEDASNVWDSDYKAVYHLQETCDGTSNEIKDSTSNSYDLTGQSPYLTQEDGFIGKALNGGSNGYAKRPSDDLDFDLIGNFILEWKMRWDSSITACSIMGKSQGGGTVVKWVLHFKTDNTINFLMGFGGSESTVQFSWTPLADTEYNCVLRRDSNNWKFFVNNTQIGSTQIDSNTVLNSTQSFHLFSDGESWKYFDGLLDEVRITKGSSRSDAYIKAVYNSEIDNILTFGSEEENFVISINETIYLGENVTLDITGLLELNVNESLYLGDLNDLSLSKEKISISEDIYLGDLNSLILDEKIEYGTRIISYNPLIILTGINPIKLVHVDISSPSSPVKTVYDVSGITNAKDIVLNETNDYFYIVGADGIVVKIEKANLNNQTIIDTIDTDDFYHTTSLDTFLRTFGSTNDSNGEIIMIDESTISKINTDIRWSKRITKIISCLINTMLGKKINLDVRYSKKLYQTISTDMRWLEYNYNDLSQYPIEYNDIQVKINGTDLAPLNDVDLKSIVIIHTKEEYSTASFVLHRKHDNPNYDNQGNSSQITNQNVVQIYIKGYLEFSGTIQNFTVDSESESITVNARMDEPTSNKQTKSIPLSSIGTQLNLYDCLLNTISVENPVINTQAVITNENGLYWSGSEWVGDLDKAQVFASHSAAQSTINSVRVLFSLTSQQVWPINYKISSDYYKGIQVNLGTKIEQQIMRYSSFYGTSSLASKIEAGTFTPKQNWSYFWFATFKHFINGTSATNLRYLGKSLGSLTADTWQLTGASYKYQKQLEDEETDLGFYYVGSAPYKLVSVQNGRLITKDKWVDKNDGLYRVKDESYDYEQYAKDIAALEYSKLKTLNDVILPVTSSEIDITVDGYYYYNLKLLTRINLSNTTTSNIYKNSNGFPVAIKTITINTSNMRVSLTCDNQLSAEEINEIDRNYPDVNSDEYINEKQDVRNFRKFDPNRWGYIE